MIIRSKAPLRLWFAWGGTDVSPYSDIFGWAILNVTINMYAHTTIITRNDNKIYAKSMDTWAEFESQIIDHIWYDGNLDLVKAVYNRIVKIYWWFSQWFDIYTHVDAPAGSGLGTSSTLTVSILWAFVEWLNLPLWEYDIAHLAYEIERIDLWYSGWKQDQYSAVFWGWNFMEFYKDDKVIVNPLRIKNNINNEIEFNLILYYTWTSRLSAKIIDAQTKNVLEKKEKSIEAMHELKNQAIKMKEALLKWELEKIWNILHESWIAKKNMANEISNEFIDNIYSSARQNWAIWGKVSWAWGWWFMIFYCNWEEKYKVIQTLQQFGWEIRNFNFTTEWLVTWKL